MSDRFLFPPPPTLLSWYNAMLHQCHQVLIKQLSSQNLLSPAPALLRPCIHPYLRSAARIKGAPPSLHPPPIKITISKRWPDRLTDRYKDRCFPFPFSAVPHTGRYTGGLFEKIPGHLFQSGTAGPWAPAIQLMSLCESINLSTKPYFVGQKAFSIAPRDRGKKKRNNGSTFHQWVRERGLEWDWKEKIVTITSEGKGKYRIARKKMSPWEGIIKMVIFSPRYRCSLALSKLIVLIILQGEIPREKRKRWGPIVRQERIKHCDIVAVKWQFSLVQADCVSPAERSPSVVFTGTWEGEGNSGTWSQSHQLSLICMWMLHLSVRSWFRNWYPCISPWNQRPYFKPKSEKLTVFITPENLEQGLCPCYIVDIWFHVIS